jgi:UDP-glucose:(heptosyl)LPS alpha-1,3-glucosyltransferase
MRVAIVQETIDSQRGGAETSTVEMARHLAELGLEVTIVCREAPADWPTDDPVKLLHIPASGFSRVMRTYRFIQTVHRLGLRQCFHIVHAVTPCLAANVYQPRGGTYAETVARNLVMVDSPAARWIKWLGQHFNLRQRFLFRLENTLLRQRRDRVFVAAVSEYVQRQVVSGYGFPEQRTRVVFNGVDIAPLTDAEIARERTELRRQLGVAPDTPLVLFVAHNFKLKGLAELIRACGMNAAVSSDIPTFPHSHVSPDVVPPDVGCVADAPGRTLNLDTAPRVRDAPLWVLVVAGRGRSGAYARLARGLGVRDRVHFVGSETPIRRWYAAADLLAHPTWYDPCSRVVLEALSLGLPAVTTRYNGAAEVMEAGRHGVVIDWPGNIAGLAAAIAQSLDPALREVCRADAARLHEQLSMARHARELKALYGDIASAELKRR